MQTVAGKVEGFWTEEAGFSTEVDLGPASGIEVVADLGFEAFKGQTGSKTIEKISSIGTDSSSI